MLSYSRHSLWRIFGAALGENYVPRPNAEIWNKLKSLGISKVTSRGCRSGVNKQRPISTVLGIGKYSGYQSFYSSMFASAWFQHMQILTSPLIDLNNVPWDCNQDFIQHSRGRNLSNLSSPVTTQRLPNSTKSLRFANINARSVKNKTAEIADHVIHNNIDVCIVTETWLKEQDTVSIALLSPPGYSFKSFPRQSDRKGGGTGIMFNNDFKVSLTRGGEKRSFEFSEWNLSIRSRVIKVIAIYRPPYSEAHPVSPSTFFDEFSDYLETVVMCRELLLFAGDFNLHLDDPLDIDAKKFNELLETFGLTQHVTGATHSSGHTLDLLISRSTNDITVRSLQATTYISDHCFIECFLSIPGPNLVMKEIQFRKLKNIDLQAFQADIAASDLCTTSSWSSLDDLVRCYNATLSQILDNHAPLRKKVVIDRPRLPWFNDELKNLKAKRRKLEKQMLKSRSQHDRDVYCNFRNKYSELLNKARNNYYSDLISDCAGNSKKLFQVVNSLCKERQENPLPPHHDSRKLADDFGEYFCRKIQLIRDDIDKIAVVPPRPERCMPDVKLDKFAFLTEHEVFDIIVQSSNASCQLDPIPTRLLKHCAKELAPVMTRMINLSLQHGHVPDNWKIALVLPLLKKSGLDLIFKNFRPVSNLSFISKSVEKAVLNQLLDHCHENAPFPTNQSSFRKFHSTETALLRVQSDILSSMDRQEVTLLVLLDLSAAFDTLDHGILVDILSSDFGIVGDALKWIESYLAERSQRVIINQESSKPFNIDYGVPQGSCLGPVLFLLYASQIFQIVSKHLPSAHGYADDTQIYLSFRPQLLSNQQQAIIAMENCIADIRAWLISHKLMFNDSKTEFLVIGSRQQLSKIDITSLKVGDSSIVPMKSARNLGSWFDSNMSMDVHIGKVCSKAFRGLYNIRQIRRFLSIDSTKTLVHAFVTSHVDYCNSLLHELPQYQQKRLQKVLNAAARVTCLLPRFAHITPVLVDLHWLPIKYRIEFKIALLVYKALNEMSPIYISELLVLKPSGPYQLRSDKQQFLLVPRTKTKFGDRAFASAGPKVWNSLPLTVRLSKNINTFKVELKTYLFKKAFNL